MVPRYSDRLILQCMAKRSLDVPGQNGEPPHIYYAGRELLILILSDGNMPEPGTPAYDTETRKVRRCLQRLIKAGAIERVDTGRRGHNSRYRLTLSAALHSGLGGPQSPPTGGS